MCECWIYFYTCYHYQSLIRHKLFYILVVLQFFMKNWCKKYYNVKNEWGNYDKLIFCHTFRWANSHSLRRDWIVIMCYLWLFQNCANGFTRVQSGAFLGQCVSCNCNGHSNDCGSLDGQCQVSEQCKLITVEPQIAELSHI